MNTQTLVLARTVCVTAIVFVLLMLLLVVNREALFSRVGLGIAALACVTVVAGLFVVHMSAHRLEPPAPDDSAPG